MQGSALAEAVAAQQLDVGPGSSEALIAQLREVGHLFQNYSQKLEQQEAELAESRKEIRKYRALTGYYRGRLRQEGNDVPEEALALPCDELGGIIAAPQPAAPRPSVQALPGLQSPGRAWANLEPIKLLLLNGTTGGAHARKRIWDEKVKSYNSDGAEGRLSIGELFRRRLEEELRVGPLDLVTGDSLSWDSYSTASYCSFESPTEAVGSERGDRAPPPRIMTPQPLVQLEVNSSTTSRLHAAFAGEVLNSDLAKGCRWKRLQAVCVATGDEVDHGLQSACDNIDVSFKDSQYPFTSCIRDWKGKHNGELVCEHVWAAVEALVCLVAQAVDKWAEVRGGLRPGTSDSRSSASRDNHARKASVRPEALPRASDGPTRHQDSRNLLDAVWSGKKANIEEALHKLTATDEPFGLNLKRYALMHRYHFYWKEADKFFEGTLLLVALLKAGHDADVDCIRLLLESEADPNDRYVMYPCGRRDTMGTFPVLAAAKLQSAELLLKFKALIDTRSTNNYYISGTALWQACWSEDACLVSHLLGHKANPRLANGFHADYPPILASSLKRSPTSNSFSQPSVGRSALSGPLSPGKDGKGIHASNGGQMLLGRKYSALGLAVKFASASNGLSEVVSELCNYATVTIHELQVAVHNANEEVVRKIGEVAAKQIDPSELLPLILNGFAPQRFQSGSYSNVFECDKTGELLYAGSRRDVHPDILAELCKVLVEHADGFPKLLDFVRQDCEEALTKSSKLERSRTLQLTSSLSNKIDPRKLFSLVRLSPIAAKILLDKVFLQAPTNDKRAPLPLQAVIDENEQMNVAYTDSLKWGLQSTSASCAGGQRSEASGRLIGCLKSIAAMLQSPVVSWQMQLQGGHTEDFGDYFFSQAGKSQFCEIKVLCLRGVVCWEMFDALASLQRADRVNVLQDSDSLKALISYTWMFSKGLHFFKIMRNLLGLASLITWAVCDASQDGEIFGSALSRETTIMLCWTVFTSCFLVELFDDVELIIGTFFEPVPSGSNTILHRAKSFVEFLFAKEEIVDRCADILYGYFVIATFGTWEGHGMEKGTKRLFGIVILWACVEVLYSLRVQHHLGYALVPILETITVMDTDGGKIQPCLAMLIILFFWWFAASLFVLVEWPYAWDEAMVRSFLNLMVGEIGMIATDSSEAFQKEPDIRNIFVIAGFLVIAVVLMNIFIAVLDTSYNNQLKLNMGSFLMHRCEVCKNVLAHRQFLIRVISRTTSKIFTAPLWVHSLVLTLFFIVLAVIGLGTLITYALGRTLSFSNENPLILLGLFFGVLMCIKANATIQVRAQDKYVLWVAMPKSLRTGKSAQASGCEASSEAGGPTPRTSFVQSDSGRNVPFSNLAKEPRCESPPRRRWGQNRIRARTSSQATTALPSRTSTPSVITLTSKDVLQAALVGVPEDQA